MKKIIFLFLISVWIMTGCGTPKEATIGVSNEGLLQILCSPGDAEVFVDGVSMGKANKFDGKPGYIKLDSGTHKIEIKKEGFAPYTRDVFAGKSLQTVEITLRKLE